MKNSLKIFVLPALIGMVSLISINACDSGDKPSRLDDKELAHKFYTFVKGDHHDDRKYENLNRAQQIEQLRSEIKFANQHIEKFEILRSETKSPLQKGLLYLMTAICHQTLKQIQFEKIKSMGEPLNRQETQQEMFCDNLARNELNTANDFFAALLKMNLDKLEDTEGKQVNRPFIMLAQAKTLKSLAYLSHKPKKKLRYLEGLYTMAEKIYSTSLRKGVDDNHRLSHEAGDLFQSLSFSDKLPDLQGTLNNQTILSLPPETVIESIRVYRDEIAEKIKKDNE